MTVLLLLLCEEKWLHGVHDPYLVRASILWKIFLKITENHKEHLLCTKAKKFRHTIEFNGKWLAQLILLRYCQVVWIVSAACITSATLTYSWQSFQWIQMKFSWILLHMIFKGKSYLVRFFCCYCLFIVLFLFLLFMLIQGSGFIWMFWMQIYPLRAQAQANQLIAVTRYFSISLAMEKGKKKGRWESSGMDTDLQLEVKRNHGDETCFLKSASWNYLHPM